MKLLDSVSRRPAGIIKLLAFVYLGVRLTLSVISLLFNRLVVYPTIGLDGTAVLNLLKSLGISLLPVCLFLVFIYKNDTIAKHPRLWAVSFGITALQKLYTVKGSLANTFNSMSHPYGGNYMLRTGMMGLQLMLTAAMAVILIMWTVKTAKGCKDTKKCQIASFIFVACAVLYMAVSLYFNIDNLLGIRVYPTRATEIVITFILSAVSSIAGALPAVVYFIFWTFMPPKGKE